MRGLSGVSYSCILLHSAAYGLIQLHIFPDIYISTPRAHQTQVEMDFCFDIPPRHPNSSLVAIWFTWGVKLHDPLPRPPPTPSVLERLRQLRKWRLWQPEQPRNSTSAFHCLEASYHKKSFAKRKSGWKLLWSPSSSRALTSPSSFFNQSPAVACEALPFASTSAPF